MGAVSGLGDSYDLPNYVGELFNITPNDTPFLSAIGGMTGGKSVTLNSSPGKQLIMQQQLKQQLLKVQMQLSQKEAEAK